MIIRNKNLREDNKISLKNSKIIILTIINSSTKISTRFSNEMSNKMSIRFIIVITHLITTLTEISFFQCIMPIIRAKTSYKRTI